VFAFANDGDPQIFIGSADMMHRNLDRRVEALVRLNDPDHLAEIDTLFDQAMDEHTSSWHLDGDGTWERHSTNEEGAPLVDLQSRLMQQTAQRARPGKRR
jgi:polyphosphate kinase